MAELSAHPLLGAGVSLALATVLLVLRHVVRQRGAKHRVDTSLGVLGCGLVFGTLTELARAAGVAGAVPYLDAVVFGALAIGAVHAGLTLFVDFYLRQRKGAVVSAVFRDVAGIILYFLVIVVVLRSTLDINVASLIATSAVLTAIVGLALQDLLNNLVGGIVLELEAPLGRGDWVRIGAYEGMVLETGWRTTKLLTRVNEVVSLPNALLSREAVVNYSRPTPLYGDTLRFEAAYEATPSAVRTAVLGVLDAEAAVSTVRRPEVWLERFGESGVGYAVRYWLSEFGELEQIRNRLMTNLWYALRRANVRIPFPARDVFVYPGSSESLVVAERRDLVGLLRAVPLLAPLDDAALAHLATRVRGVTFGAGERVVQQGDAGDSFFVLVRGAAEVLLENGGAHKVVAQLGPGGFFGEMSLLTGESRTATVRATTDLELLVIDREAFREVIVSHPALLAPLCELTARRQAEQAEHRRSMDVAAERTVAQQAQRLSERIRAFFGL